MALAYQVMKPEHTKPKPQPTELERLRRELLRKILRNEALRRQRWEAPSK